MANDPTRRCFVLDALVLGALTAGMMVPVAADAAGVRSLLEMRRDQVVVQDFDLSCGAAALATILNYQHGLAVTEREIALGLIRRPEYLDNPDLVRLRQGFSLLDLKRYVETRGYKGIGFGQLEFEHLDRYAPIIVPVNLKGYNHFVVYRGRLGDKVLLADPAYGNRTLTLERFQDAWLDYPELGHIGFIVERADGLIPPNMLVARPEDFLVLQ